MSAPLVRTSTPGIYKRGSRYVVKERDHTGRIQTKSAATLAQAKTIKAQIRTDSARGEFRPASNVTFTDYALEWIDSYTGRTSRGFKETTRSDYRGALKNHAIPYFRRMPLAHIEPRDVKRFAQSVADKGLSRDGVRNAVAPLKALLATAFEDGVIRHNPATNVRLATNYVNADGEVRRVKSFSDTELACLIAAVDDDNRLVIELLASTGLRIGELIALRWCDMDLERGRLHVSRRLYRGTYDTPKSRFGIRTVPLTPDMRTKLTAHRLSLRSSGDLEPVFQTSTGTPMCQNNILRRVLKPAAIEIGMPWATLHMLRHTFATRCFRNGCNLKQVQALLGHHSAAFTLETYVHLLPEDLPDLGFLDNLPTTDARVTPLRSA
ncbi:MAG: hypothetical protein JWN72_2319 [Thermoleophilia bacterium]|nr:hypothetical protein [Thermoleophilia bacterium]